ncbi:MAG TPA: glycine--tRNA ligase subunit beta [Kofleriaceae bacterium]|nr:glycine--tRNA ligase subunit beta [Kofleriaceae bacterium]
MPDIVNPQITDAVAPTASASASDGRPADLLFEIGCEEIPAKMLARALAELPAAVEQRLAAARLAHGAVRALGTPRRLAVIVKGLADRQPDLVEEVVGPPVSAAFAPDGSVTKAGQGFAAKSGVDPASLTKKEVPGKKGLYAVAIRNVAGGDTRSLLPAMLRDLAAAIPWPKSQRWGWGMTAFVRPVQWLLALYGGEVVPVAWADLTAGRTTRGHRFLSRGEVSVASPAEYVETLRAHHVVVDPEARRELVRAELSRLEQETGLRVRPDPALLDEVIHLGEYPVGLCGQFDPSYLEVPEEIIVTAMRTHQRYFAMEDQGGKLANRFTTLMATVVKDPAVVQRGNEYVIASRLADAKFFFAEDRKKSFAEWNKKLDAVVFQAKLGDRARTIGHKVQRIARIAGALARHVGADADTVAAAAGVCKADLASSAVGEFPELQGVMGRHYARHFGLSDEIARAIDEHWWPKGQGAALPPGAAGALIALADRMDTVAGCFAVGLEPSGSADPLGLRRAAIGIWLILLAHEGDERWASLWPVLFDEARAALAEQGVAMADTASVEKFFRDRLRGIFVDQGIPTQDAEAALAQSFRDPIDARARALAIARIPKEAREVFKRVANILDDARKKHKLEPADRVDPALFAADNTVEQKLHAAMQEAREREAEPRRRRDYAAVFDSLVQLQPTVAAFFDRGGVMVMDPDPKLRDNRLALLLQLIQPYLAIADFRLLGAAS